MEIFKVQEMKALSQTDNVKAKSKYLEFDQTRVNNFSKDNNIKKKVNRLLNQISINKS